MFSSAKAVRKEGLCFIETLWFGLEHLYSTVRNKEFETLAKLGISPEEAMKCYSSRVGSEPDSDHISNCFMWYASTFYNFRGSFRKVYNKSAALKDFERIIVWRHKVGGHAAWWLLNKKDTDATRSLSISPFPEFSGGRFEVGGWVFSPGYCFPIEKLRKPVQTDKLSQYLRSRLSPTLEHMLKKAKRGGSPQLQDALNVDIHRIAESGPLYDSHRFAGIKHSKKAKELIATNPTGDALVALNSMLIEEAFPPPFARGPSQADWHWCLTRNHEELKEHLKQGGYI